MSLEKLTRRKVRYWCFRFHTEAIDGVDSSDAPEGLKEKFEEMEWFQGWDKFGVSWDISEEDNFRIVPRKTSIHQDWDKVIMSKFPVLPLENIEKTHLKSAPATPKKTRKTKKKGK